jgi:integrase
MPTLPNFTAAALRDAKPGTTLTEKTTPGLRLAATSARKSWIFRYVRSDGGKGQVKLGHWPGMSIEAARTAAAAARSLRDAGTDPARSRRTAAVQRARDERARAYSLGAAIADYLREHVERNRAPKGAAEARRLLGKLVPAKIAAQPLAALTRADAFRLVQAQAGTPDQARRLRAELRAVVDHARDAGRLDAAAGNPFEHLLRGKLRLRRRQHHLAEAEAGALLAWLRSEAEGMPSRAVREALALTLYTGLRSGEAVGLRTSDVRKDALGLEARIPAERMKARREHIVPLEGEARRIVERRAAEAGADAPLFPSPLAGRAMSQKALGAAVWLHSEAGRDTRPDERRRIAPVKFAPHDLRRTARTLLQALGCPFEVAEAILAHRLPGVAAAYAKGDLLSERREWLRRLGEKLDALAAGAKVVPLRPKAAA